MASSARKKRERLRNANLTPLSQLSLRGVLLEPGPASPLISTTNLVPGLTSSVLKLDRLGKGATSNVFRAVHAATLKMVALKEVSVSTEADRRAVRTEMRALDTQRRPLLHSDFTTDLAPCPRIVDYYGSIMRENGNACIAVEYVAGGSLESWLESGYRCPEAWIAHIAHHALEALDFVHNCGRVHRDVKPANLLITRRGDLKLADFGAAGVENSSRMVGTQRYMAPERLKGRPATPQSDLWSLGLTLATAALGDNPICKASSEFEQTELADRAERTIKKEKSLSPGLADFLGKCLARNHTRRPALSELMQHDFLKQKEDWASKCPEVARAMRDRKRQQREDASALSTEAVLDALCQARAEDNIMGARSRVDTSTAADLAYELGVSPKSLVKRVRQRTQQLIRKRRDISACACSVHIAGRRGGDGEGEGVGEREGGGGDGGGDGGVFLSGGSCCDTSSSDRFICIDGDGLDSSPGGLAPFCGFSPRTPRPFTSTLSLASAARKSEVSSESTAVQMTAAPVAKVSSVPDSAAPTLHPAEPAAAEMSKHEPGGGANTLPVVAVQTVEGMARNVPLSKGGLVHARVAHEDGKISKRKLKQVSSRVILTPHKRRGEKERKALKMRSSVNASGAQGRDYSKSRRPNGRHHRRRHRDDDFGGSHSEHGLVGESRSATYGGGGGGGGGVGVGGGRDRRISSRHREEVPRTAVSRMLPSRSKLLRATRHVFQLADKMKTDLKVKDRIHRLRVYKECFSGREAVQWMIANGHASSVNEAERLGNEMMKNGVFEHISNSHLFEDSSVLYRFSDGEELPRPASGGRRIGQMARVVFQSLVNGVLGGKDDYDFEVQISEIVLGTVSEPPERSDSGCRVDVHRGTASEGNSVCAKKGAAGAGSDFPTSAPSTVSSGPFVSTANVGSGENADVVVRVHTSAPSGGNPTFTDVKPPRLPRSDRKNRKRQSSGVRLGNLRRVSSSTSATTMPETPTPF